MSSFLKKETRDFLRTIRSKKGFIFVPIPKLKSVPNNLFLNLYKINLKVRGWLILAFSEIDREFICLDKLILRLKSCGKDKLIKRFFMKVSGLFFNVS